MELTMEQSREHLYLRFHIEPYVFYFSFAIYPIIYHTSLLRLDLPGFSL